jgi:hypothetical protein
MTSTKNSTTSTHLALYIGAGGPCSVELTCAGLDEAADVVSAHESAWYDQAEDALGLPAGCADEGTIDDALARHGWHTVASSSAGRDGAWSLYRRA